MNRLACVVVLAAAVVARADEEKVPLDKLPKAVVAAVKARFPKAEMTEGAKEEDDQKKTVYEVTLKEGGKNIDVTLTPEGVITAIEKEIAVTDLPKAVADGIEAKYPKGAVKFAEEVIKVTDGKEALAYYEARVETADKKTVEVEVAADGKVLKTEDKTGKKD